MWTVIVILVVVWVILAIVGFVFEGLFWLGLIGVVLAVGTLIFAIVREGARKRGAGGSAGS